MDQSIIIYLSSSQWLISSFYYVLTLPETLLHTTMSILSTSTMGGPEALANPIYQDSLHFAVLLSICLHKTLSSWRIYKESKTCARDASITSCAVAGRRRPNMQHRSFRAHYYHLVRLVYTPLLSWLGIPLDSASKSQAGAALHSTILALLYSLCAISMTRL